MKKIITFILTAVLLLTAAHCETTEVNELQIGSSAFSIILPEGYAAAEDELDEDQIAYYQKDDQSIDFDIYQWAKEGIYTLETEAAYFAEQYGSTPELVVINGIQVMKYTTLEEYEGFVYTVVNYMFEDEESIVELCFWTIDTAEEYAAVEEIINTLKKIEAQ